MRIFAVLLIMTAAIFSPISATRAEAQCLLCGVIGFAIGSASNDKNTGAGAGGSVIYIAPYIGERIADPLDVRIVAKQFSFSEKLKHWDQYAGKYSLRQLFENAVEEHEKYTLLEIMRVVDYEYPGVAVFWFAYIENEKMKPLSKLPSN
jgi:hypothetical protein